MKKIFKILPILVLLTACNAPKEVSEEAFDKFAAKVTDTSNPTQINAKSIIKCTGYEYFSNNNEVREVNMNEEMPYTINKENGEWVTDESSQYLLEYIQENALSNYKKAVLPDKDFGKWHYYTNPIKIYVTYQEDQLDKDVTVHISQSFTYIWDKYGRIVDFTVKGDKVWDLNGKVEGYGNQIKYNYIQKLTVSYK